MGSLEYCYKSILKDFILYNNEFAKQYKNLEENILPNKTIEELEEMALEYYKKNKDYSIFLMGACVKGFIHEWDECNDMLNACAGAIGDIQDLFNIDEDKESNFPILEWHDFETDPPKYKGKYLIYDKYGNIEYLLWSNWFKRCWNKIPEGEFTWWSWNDRGWTWDKYRITVLKWAEINLPEVR